MAKFEFIQDRICIQSNASEWGPFTFNFADGLPTGKTLSSVTVKSYLGRVKPDNSDTLSSFIETTSELIGTTAVVSDTQATVQFNRPTTSTYINANHTLVFTVTLSGGGGTHDAFYYRVEVL